MSALLKASDVAPPSSPPEPWLGRLARIPGALVESTDDGPPAERREAILSRTSFAMANEAVAIGLSTRDYGVRPAAPPPAEEPPAPQASGWHTANEARLEAARAEAFEAGRAEALRELQAEAEMAKAAFAADIEQLAMRWTAHHERVERQLVALALEAAEMIVGGPLPDALRDAADRAVVQAVETLAAGSGVAVRLHPVDFLRLQEAGIVDGLSAAHPALRWSPDEALQEGDWVVESVEAAVRHVRAELLDGLRARLDLLQAVQDAPGPSSATSAAPQPTAPQPTPTSPASTPPASSD